MFKMFSRAELLMLTIPCIILFKFHVILLHYSPISMHYSQNYSQDHCPNNPGALKMIPYCKVRLFYWSNNNPTH